MKKKQRYTCYHAGGRSNYNNRPTCHEKCCGDFAKDLASYSHKSKHKDHRDDSSLTCGVECPMGNICTRKVGHMGKHEAGVKGLLSRSYARWWTLAQVEKSAALEFKLRRGDK